MPTSISNANNYLLLCMAGVNIQPSALLTGSITGYMYDHHARTMYVDPTLTLDSVGQLAGCVLGRVINRSVSDLLVERGPGA